MSTSRILVTIRGGGPEDTAKAVEVINAALTAAGYPPHRPARHLRAVPDRRERAS